VKPRASRARSFRAAAWLAFWLACAHTVCWGQASRPATEHAVKAAFLYKFLHFVEWPPPAFADAHSPLVIGVLGSEVLASELAVAVEGRTANGHPVMTRRLNKGDPVAGLHMLFVDRDHALQVHELLAAARGKPLLVVTESEESFAQGSTINFVLEDDKVRFDVAVGPAEAHGLRISSRLLAVARRVIPSPS
jgi:hypothetical protein